MPTITAIGNCLNPQFCVRRAGLRQPDPGIAHRAVRGEERGVGGGFAARGGLKKPSARDRVDQIFHYLTPTESTLSAIETSIAVNLEEILKI
jgi:hypothetical protein